jgi:hypothetical protein
MRTLGILLVVSVGVACAGTSGNTSPDQEPTENGLAPIRLGADKLAGKGLEEYGPMSDVTEGGTAQRGVVFHEGEQLTVGVWEADAATIPISAPLPYDEFVTILSGKLVLTDQNGNATEYAPGESVLIPKGFIGIWQMVGDFREIYIVETNALVAAEGGE